MNKLLNTLAAAGSLTLASVLVPTPAHATAVKGAPAKPLAVCSSIPTASKHAAGAVPLETGPTTTQLSNFASGIYLAGNGTRIYGDSGVHLVLTFGETVSTTWTHTGTIGADAGIILAKASVSYSLSFQTSHTNTVGAGGDWTVPATQAVGWLEAGTHGYAFNYYAYHYISPCKLVVEAQGRAVVPATNSAIWYHHS